MSQYPPYPHCKASGVDWLGDVPDGWGVKKLSHFFYAQKGTTSSLLTREYCASIDGQFPVYSGQTENAGIMAFINFFEFDVTPTSVLLSTTVGAKAMSLQIISGQFSLSQNCMIIGSKASNIFIKFYYYHFLVLFAYYRAMIPEYMQASFRMQDLYSYSLALPPLPEQHAIAAFLDRETGRIDELVAKKKSLIEKLKEQRTAVISAAVTKGLPPKVAPRFGLAPHTRFVPSGVDWLGDVPDGWGVKKIRRQAFLITDKAAESGNPVALENIEGWTGKFISSGSSFEGDGVAFTLGDILFGKLRPYLAKGANCKIIFWGIWTPACAGVTLEEAIL